MVGKGLSWSDNRALNRLMTAIYSGDTAQALSAIQPDLPLDAIAKGQHESPIFAAIEHENVSVLEALLAAGASVALPNEFGETPLQAAANKSEQLVRLLLARGAGVNAPIVRRGHQYDGRTPLMQAACANNLAVVKLLLEHGADPFAKDASGMTALSFAEIFGKRVATHLRKIMAKSPATSDLGMHDAARAGLIDRVRALLEGGTAVDAHDERKRTALHHAVTGGHAGIVRLLLDRGAAVDAQDAAGFRPLMLAEDKLGIVQALLASGARPNAEAGGGMTAFLYLSGCASPEVLGALIDAGADLQARSPDGMGVLDYAKSNRHAARRVLKERMGLASDAIDLLYAEMKELTGLAKQPRFESAAARLGELFNRKPAPWRRRKGILYFHDVAILKHLAPHFGESAGSREDDERLFGLMARLQDQISAEGFTLVYVDAIPEEGRLPLILLPTANKYAALLACGTNGINKGHDTEAVIRWLMTMEEENPFILTGCGHDFLHGRFARAVKDAERLAERMIAFCPDMVDQAAASLRWRSRPAQVTALATELSDTGWFGFWWD